MKENNSDLKTLFDQCYQKSSAQQQEIINQSHVSDEVKKKLRKLLAINIENVELTSNIIDNVQLSLDINPILTGMKVESYILQRPLGAGGQGEVWLAKRDSGDFNHQVAIKFLKPVHNQKELDRFNNERELLAQLKHNNIAQLLGGGQLPDNRPYMILELVEGMPLMDYCKQHNYSLKQYLTCFLQICDAISYAHSYLVIHRDIKPSNIFVNNEGVVKLLDFGIAKIIDSQELNTETVPIMTLAYSSPEQVTGATISTATDIYTLGLVLYEMLTGQRAQAVVTDAPAELIHEITDKTPTNPSEVEVLLTLDRNYTNKQLKGDLDNLILMSVRKEPQRRYATVATMARDVKNYLEGKPLLAAGDSHWYKTKKLVIRNPVISALTLLTVGFLIILPIILYNSQIQIKKQRDLEIVARKEAQKQSEIAQQQETLSNRTTDFLFNILESASPLASKGKPINLDDVLESAERRLTHGLDNQPVLKANLLNKLASIQHHLGNEGKSVAFYEKALKIYKTLNNSHELLKAYGQLAIVNFNKGDRIQSDLYREKANVLSSQISDPFQIGWHHARMATMLNYLNQKEEVRKTLPQVILGLDESKIANAELLGRMYNELAISYIDFDNEKALEHITRSVNYSQSINGDMHPKSQNRLSNKANILVALKRYDEAEALFLTLKTNAQNLYTINHPAYSKLIAEMASLYHDLGRFDDAEILYIQAKGISEKTTSKTSFIYILQTNNLGYLYEDKGQYERAEKYYQESLKIRQKHYSDDQVRVASSMGNLARLLTKMGEFKQAQNYLDQVIPIYILNNKPNLSNNIVQIAINLGQNTSQKQCHETTTAIEGLLPQVQKISNKSWRRMYYELWLGKMAHICKNTDLSDSLLQAAKEKSLTIYAKDSEGQKRIQLLVNQLL